MELSKLLLATAPLPQQAVCYPHVDGDPWDAQSWTDFCMQKNRELTSYEDTYLVERKWAPVIGTAFDYLARGRTAARAGSSLLSKEASTGLKAELAGIGLRSLGSFSRGRSRNDSGKVPPLLIMHLEEILVQSLEVYRDLCFARSAPDEKLYPALYFLSRMEELYRSSDSISLFNFAFASETADTHTKMSDGTAGQYFITSLETMRHIYEKTVLDRHFPLEEQENKNVSIGKRVLFNPSFGSVSAALGGADADIVIDGVLYDFKTGRGNKARRFSYDRIEAAQIFAYWYAHLLTSEIKDNSSDSYGTSIHAVALYHARIGRIMEWSGRELIEESYAKVRSALADIVYKFVFYKNTERGGKI